MKVKILLFASVIYFGMVSLTMAAGVGDFITPIGNMKVAVSVEDNIIFDRDLSSSGDVTGGEVSDSNQTYAKLALGLGDNFNVYGKVGIANLEYKINWDVSRSQTLKFDYGLLWGVGSSCLHEFENNFGVGVDVQFNMWYTDGDSISGSNNPVFIDKGSLKNGELQSSLYLTYSYEADAGYTIVPYVGGYYAEFKADVDDSIKFRDDVYEYTAGDLEEDDNIGILIGTSLLVSENLSFNVEGRFISETALTVAAGWEF